MNVPLRRFTLQERRFHSREKKRMLGVDVCVGGNRQRSSEGRVKVTAIAEKSLGCHGDGVVFNIPPHGQKLPAGL